MKPLSAPELVRAAQRLSEIIQGSPVTEEDRETARRLYFERESDPIRRHQLRQHVLAATRSDARCLYCEQPYKQHPRDGDGDYAHLHVLCDATRVSLPPECVCILLTEQAKLPGPHHSRTCPFFVEAV